MVVWLAPLALAPALAALELRAERQRLNAQIYLLKPLATATIALLALAAPAPVSPLYRTAVVAGLLCSLAGDVFLMLPRNYFLRGLVSFLFAHGCYVVAFVSLAGWPRSPVAALLPAACGLWLLRRLWPRLGKYRWPVAVYDGVLMLMLAAALQQALGNGAARAWVAALGAGLFVASDTLLAIDRFETGWKRRQLLVLATYFTAQWLIAASVHRF